LGVLSQALEGLGLRLNATKTRIAATNAAVELVASQRALRA
jgi:hypothetical protein